MQGGAIRRQRRRSAPGAEPLNAEGSHSLCWARARALFVFVWSVGFVARAVHTIFFRFISVHLVVVVVVVVIVVVVIIIVVFFIEWSEPC